MAKKRGVKSKKQMSNREIQIALIDNFVSLQRVLTNVTVKFDTLSDNISRLLQLFEVSAKSFLEKYGDGLSSGTANNDDKDLIKKLDTLLEQNKTIAKGLTLIEEKIRHKAASGPADMGFHEAHAGGHQRPRPFTRM